jgi:hypothetical protein
MAFSGNNKLSLLFSNKNNIVKSPEKRYNIIMKHKINPMIDCVFKEILGSEEHKGLLIHFLNAVLIPTGSIPIKKVDLLRSL